MMTVETKSPKSKPWNCSNRAESGQAKKPQDKFLAEINSPGLDHGSRLLQVPRQRWKRDCSEAM